MISYQTFLGYGILPNVVILKRTPDGYSINTINVSRSKLPVQQFEVLKDGTLKERPLLQKSYTPIRRHVKSFSQRIPMIHGMMNILRSLYLTNGRITIKELVCKEKISSFQEGKMSMLFNGVNITNHRCISLRKKASKGSEYDQIILMSFTTNVMMSRKRKELHL